MTDQVEGLKTLELAGVEFFDGPYTGDGGPGVRLRESQVDRGPPRADLSRVRPSCAWRRMVHRYLSVL